MENKPAPWLEPPRKPNCPPPILPPAPFCDDQLPIFSRVGRGIKGDSLEAETYEQDGHIFLKVTQIDEADGTRTVLVDRCIDGGYLEYEYNLNPFNDPSTFTLTFHYDHPDPELGWTWTTPAIPYMWFVDPDTGEPTATGIIGSGVSSLFIKKTGESWNKTNLPTSTPNTSESTVSGRQEKLLYPASWTRSQFNAPKPWDPWTVNLTYGVGGDFDAPNIDDLAKILGVSPASLRTLAARDSVPTATFGGKNAKEYIDNLMRGYATMDDLDVAIDELSGHIHNDMGFGNQLVEDGGRSDRNTIKKYINGLRADVYKHLGLTDPSNTDAKKQTAAEDISLSYTNQWKSPVGTPQTYNSIVAYIDAIADDIAEGKQQVAAANTAINQIVAKMGGTIDASGTITWPSYWNANDKVAAGNINILSSTTANSIRTHADNFTGDIKAN